jgi:phosphoribosylformylglycinamidine (FGAM) synthase-like enzyme
MSQASFDINTIPEPASLQAAIDWAVTAPNLTGKRWVAEQFKNVKDGEDAETNSFSDAGFLNIQGTDNAFAITSNSNARYVYADAEKGSMIVVAEAARDIICSGGQPISATCYLNFGDLSNPDVAKQFSKSISGIRTVCSKFNTPITAGDLYTNKRMDLLPVPNISMIGVIDDKKLQTSVSFKEKGDLIFMLGKPSDDVNASEYLAKFHNIKETPAPSFDLDEEFELHNTIKNLIASGVIQSCKSVAEGGLFSALFNKCLHKDLGFDITLPIEFRRDAILFGEAQSRAVVSVTEDNLDLFLQLVGTTKSKALMLGHVTKSELRIDHESYGFATELKAKFNSALDSFL